MNYYVYETTNLINNKKYIGKRACSCDIEKDKYLGSGYGLKNAIKKYGRKNFSKKFYVFVVTKKKLMKWREKLY